MKTYNVVHFVPQLKGGLFPKNLPIENQITDIINQQAASGWAFESYQTAHVHVKPGCFASLFGNKEEILGYDIMIFSK